MALVVDIIVLMYTLTVQREYVLGELRKRKSSGSGFLIVFKQLIVSNAVGVAAFVITAFLVRG